MRKKRKVADMAEEVLVRQARARADRTGEPFEDALGAVLETEAGRQLREWQESLARERAEALGWSSTDEPSNFSADVPRRGPR